MDRCKLHSVTVINYLITFDKWEPGCRCVRSWFRLSQLLKSIKPINWPLYAQDRAKWKTKENGSSAATQPGQNAKMITGWLKVIQLVSIGFFSKGPFPSKKILTFQYQHFYVITAHPFQSVFQIKCLKRVQFGYPTKCYTGHLYKASWLKLAN